MPTKTTLLSMVIVVIVCVGTWMWLSRYEERPVVDILASREPQLGLPVYSQFVVTQSLSLDTIASVTRLAVPMFIPSDDHSMAVRLYRNGKLVQEWQSPTAQTGVVEAEFVLDKPTLLDGDLEVQFAGNSISHEDKDRAPRIFIESSDVNYPHGNYRIAGNEKQGDVSLQLFERNKSWELFVERFQDEPLRQLAIVGTWLLLLMLLGTMPRVIYQQQRDRHSEHDDP